MRVISVARDFSRYPAGRYTSDGPFSGQFFRESQLLPALKAGEVVSIELDGVRGYGSSFLEEAFGGLVRAGHAPDAVRRQIKLLSADPSLIEEIVEYIEHGDSPDVDA